MFSIMCNSTSHIHSSISTCIQLFSGSDDVTEGYIHPEALEAVSQQSVDKSKDYLPTIIAVAISQLVLTVFIILLLLGIATVLCKKPKKPKKLKQSKKSREHEEHSEMLSKT